ncbi:MAG TPA: hypothetical protein VFM18_21925 [Methanosarcina sp.]|nr:hypothetical protein [Methanosarcina sp.]
MQPLLDADVLAYEIGFAAEVGWKSMKEGEVVDPPPFEYVAELLDNRIAEICGKVMATEPPILYLTGKSNFRDKIAKKIPYKGNRDTQKRPFHYKNLRAYMQVKYRCVVTDGIEADDAMCIEQVSVPRWGETIICTRDKDLRQCPGWHFGWELGNQPQFGPELVEGFGYIKLSSDNKKLTGVGDKFFYAQVLMGDQVDSVPGLPNIGPKKAYELLVNTNTKEEAEKAVVEAYKGAYGDNWREEMLEQAQLVWMVRELDEEGNPVMWEFIE